MYYPFERACPKPLLCTVSVTQHRPFVEHARLSRPAAAGQHWVGPIPAQAPPQRPRDASALMDRAPIHLGHGENVYAFGAAVLPIIHAMQEVERIADLHGRAAQSARLDRVYAARVTARLGVAEADEFGEGRILLAGTNLALSAAKLSGAAWALTEPAPESRANLPPQGPTGRALQRAAVCGAAPPATNPSRFNFLCLGEDHVFHASVAGRHGKRRRSGCSCRVLTRWRAQANAMLRASSGRQTCAAYWHARLASMRRPCSFQSAGRPWPRSCFRSAFFRPRLLAARH